MSDLAGQGQSQGSRKPRRVAYIVSRFPATSETFVVRELNAVATDPDLELQLMSLFPARDERPHESGERWLAGLQRPGPAAGSLALGRWLLRRPLRLLRSIGQVIADHYRSPALLLRSLATIPLAAALAERVRDDGIDHLHAHFANYPALAAWLIQRLTGAGYSFTAHAHDIFVDQSGLARRIADAQFVATISDFNARFLAELNPSGTPIEIVRMGIDPNAYPYRPRAAPDTGPVRALCVASLQEKKGHRVLFEALAGEPALERLHLDLVGGGELLEPLRSLARELGISDRVDFQGGLDEGEVRERLASADLFVLPSIVAGDGQMEGVPVALMEAIASGLLVVGSRMSGVPELVRDERVGLLAEPGDVGSLRAALRAAIAASPPSPEGRELVEREYNVLRSGRRMAELLAALD